MDKLDRLVTDHLVKHLFERERLTEILSSLAGRRAQKEQSLNARIASLQREAADADDKLKRLYKLVEDGLTDLDDVLKERLNALKAERDHSKPYPHVPGSHIRACHLSGGSKHSEVWRNPA